MPVAVNGSGQASVVITFPPSEEGNRNITAAYSGVSGTYAASSTAAGINELTVNHPYNPSGATFCNGPVYINDNLGLAGGTGGYPYASQLVLGSSFSQLQGTIENVTVSLNGLQSEQPDFNGFLLVSPAGQAFEFMSWADGIGPGGTPSGLTDLNLTLSDNGSGSLQSTENQVDCSSTPCKAADDYSLNGPLYNDTFPSPAPSNIGKAYPTGSATFTSQFGGAGANGTWLLYLNNWLAEDPSSNSSLPYGEVGSWCLNFTMQANAHPTTTSASGSPNPASFSSPATTASVNLTANVSVTDASGLTVSAGTVSFVDGATTLGSSPVSNGQATLSASLGEGTHQIVATYSGTNTGTEFGISTSTFDLRVDTATTNPASGAGTYKYCNTGSITAPGLGLDSGPAAPYPSNIFVTNLPGTVNAVTVTLNGFSTRDQGDLLALLVGPGGNNLDFFSLTGSDVSSAPAPINLTFSDSGSGIGGNLSSSGTYRPTSFNTNIAYPQCPPNANLCGSENVGPPLASNPFTPTNKAATAGTSVLGNASEAGVFGGTTASTYNGNGTWSLYLDDGGPTGGGELTNVTNGWCLNLTENLPVLAISKSHTGDFAQGQTGAQYSVVVTNDGPGPTAGTVTVTENPPTGLTVTGMSGNNWNCSTSSCTRSDGLAQSNRYDTITVTVNVSSNAASSVTNSVSVSGGGTISTVTANDQTTINPAPLLGITKSPNGTFTQGQTGEWILTVFNTVAGSATNGVVTVTDTLPTNYIVENISGTGWGCVGAGTGSASCTSEQVVAGGSSFSPIVLMVNIPANSPTSVTNNASTYGGGDLYHTNASNAATAFSTVNVAQSQFVLTTAANPSNGGTVSPTSGGSYNSGTVVPIVASPAAGYAFVNWTSSPGSVASSTSASTTITMNAAESVTANFTVALTYTPSLNFDTVYTNSTHKLTGTITNNSATNVTFTGATITLGTANLGAYKPLLYCTGTPLKPGKSCTFAVDFAPGSQTGTLTATMNILDSAGTQEVSLTGNVIDPVVEFINPTTQSVMKTLAFGPVAVNGSLTLPVQLTNSGQTDLDISNVTITGLNAGEYSANNLCPASLTPTNSCTIEVTFAPTVKGAAGATLVVTDNVVAGKSSIPITGNGHEK